MKKLLCLACLGLLMLTATYASPPRDAVQATSETVVFTADAQPDFVDFVFVSYDMDMTAITPEIGYVHYKASPIEWYMQVFDFSEPVFRLCRDSKNILMQSISESSAGYIKKKATARHVKI